MKYIYLAMGSLISFTGTAALAQDAGAPPPPPPLGAEAAHGEIGEVIVTARKRQERLEDTPISITAVTADEMHQRGATNIGDLQSAAPNLTISTSAPIAGSTNAAQIFIRGIGQTDFTPNTEPGVGVYLDGVYMAHTLGSLMDLLDIQSVEILRGPQGTLFGRNTIGGAVNITSKRPDSEFGGWIEADIGNYGEKDLKGSLNLPINDKVLVSISGGTENNDGFVERVPFHGAGGGREGNKHTEVGRGVVELKPTDDLDILFSVDGTHDHGASLGAVALAVNPTASFTGFYNGVQAPALVPTLGSQAFYTSQWVSSDPYKSYSTGPNASDDNVIGLALNTTYDIGPVTLKSITAYRNTQGYFALDQDLSPLTLAWTSDGYRDEEVSQEFQVLGKALDDRLSYVGGLYYSDEQATDTNLVYFPVVFITSGGFNDNSSEAVFGQATYKVLDNFDVTAGLRYTYDTTEYTPVSKVISSPIFPAGLDVLPPGKVRATYHDLSPEVNLAYHWTPDVMTYFNYSAGYKSGGFTQRVFPPLSAVPVYSPEYATVFEIGTKTTIAHKVRINADVFHTDYTDVQVLVVNGIAPQTENAASATIDGAEFEMTAVPVDNLVVTANAGYTYAHYTKLDPGVQVTLDDRFPFTPRWNLGASIAYDINLPDEWVVTPRFDINFRSMEYYDAVNSIHLRQGDYEVSNLGITVQPPGDRIEGFVHVNNLFDTRYLATGSDALDSQGFSFGVYGAPINVVAGIRIKF